MEQKTKIIVHFAPDEQFELRPRRKAAHTSLDHSRVVMFAANAEIHVENTKQWAPTTDYALVHCPNQVTEAEHQEAIVRANRIRKAAHTLLRLSQTRTVTADESEM